MKIELFKKKLMWGIGEHFRRYAHAFRFAIGPHGAWKIHPIVKYKHYQISSGARASLGFCIYISHGGKRLLLPSLLSDANAPHPNSACKRP